MNYMNYKFGILFTVTILAISCAPRTSEFGNPKIADDTLVSKIEKGVTTQAQVKALIGEPAFATSTDTGDTIWTYSYTKGTSKVNNAAFIPIAGSIVAASNGTVKSQIDTVNLTIRFSPEGIVRSIDRGSTSNQNTY